MVAACAAMGVASVALSHVDPVPRGTRAAIVVGSLELAPCTNVPAYCGTLDRPLDPTGSVAGRIGIHFEYYPHPAAGKSQGLMVATEGGPGYPATLSRDEYLALFAPLRRNRDVLIMDNRGTGQSGAVDCRALQTATAWTVELMGACGESLGARAPLYSTAYAADDLAAILEALKAPRIDLYGDSYGTYFEQVYALRHPKTLRSIVLDGAYPLNGPDYAWYPTYAPAMRDKFDLACRRDANCSRLPGSSVQRMQPLLETLRAHPFPAEGADSDGATRHFTADASQLAIVMFGSAPALATVREFDAAARAFLTGDRPPLLRLMAETVSGVDSRDPTADSTQWSAGLAAAVMCQDPPQIFDMSLPPRLREADRDRALAERRRLHPDTYAPFSIDEYRGMPLDYSFIDQCVDWPAPQPSHPPSHVVADDAQYPQVPALILSGDLDNMTTLADGAATAAAFPHGTQITIANGFHVNALPHSRSACGAAIVRHFIEFLEPGDTACAAEVPPVRLLPGFALHAADLPPAGAAPGDLADAERLRWVSAAVFTAGDVLTRLANNSSGHGVGLRGGRFSIVYADNAVHVKLHEVRFTEDLSVSGTIDKPQARTGTVRAILQVATSGGRGGALDVEWPEGVAHSIAEIRGRLDGATVRASMPAP
jgi:pimeloyl-ACP methyl ester carboxylesterase